MTDSERPPEPPGRAARPSRTEHIALGHDDGLVLRAPTLDDLEDLERFYDGLPLQDRRRRFFSAFRPDRATLRSWIERTPREGRRLIAVRDTARPSGGERASHVVADAGFVRRDDGDAELDLVVAPGARGWLGGYLLDRLVLMARADGVRNLRADVLVDNGPMLALIQHRRHAAAGHDDHTVAHLLIATAEETPVWGPDHDRPRILIEGGGLGWVPLGMIRSLGVDALMCPGPRDAPAPPCPVLVGRRCPLVDGADAIVCALGPPERSDALLDAHARTNPTCALFRSGAAGRHRIVALPDDRPPLEAAVRALGLSTDLPHRHPDTSAAPAPPATRSSA